jgi:hypothetical protein
MNSRKRCRADNRPLHVLGEDAQDSDVDTTLPMLYCAFHDLLLSVAATEICKQRPLYTAGKLFELRELRDT